MEAVLGLLVERSSVPVTTAFDPDRLRPIELPVLQGSHDKLTAATGWEPALSLAQTLADLLDDTRARVSA
jgi:GDP-4-dehydro-6-deoxy-D-mannose reductase